MRGNRVIGATDEKQFAVPIVSETLACDRDKGIRVRPEHIHTALRELAGIADHPMSKRVSARRRGEGAAEGAVGYLGISI